MDLRCFRPLREAGATYKEIAAEVGVDWRTVRKYLAADAGGAPPAAPARVGTQARKTDKVAHLIDAWLADDLSLRASVIHERLVAGYGFDGHYQRVKLYVAEARERIAIQLGERVPSTGLHRRFEVTPGAQAPGGLGTRVRGVGRRTRGGARVLVPHDAVLLAASIRGLHHLPGPGHVLGLPRRGVRLLRWSARHDRL
jgi:hypothetical protein